MKKRLTLNVLVLNQKLFRLKKNAVIREIQSFDVLDDSNILSDNMAYIDTIQNRTENFFRLAEVVNTKGNILCLITKQFDLDVDEIMLFIVNVGV